MESLRALIDALPSPVWARDLAGALVFANPAFARAVEAKDPADAIARGVEMLNRTARDEASRSRAAGKAFAARLPAIVAGSRRTFDVLDVPTRKGSAGIGIDATEAEAMRGELKRLLDAHRRTLDQLADRRRHLRRRPEADLLQFGLSLAVGPRRRLPRPDADRFRGARPVARRAQAAGGAGLPAVEGRAARGLSRDRDQGAPLAPAGRPHAARRHHAQSAGRRHLSVRGHHRAARAGAPLRRAQPRAGRDARQSRRGRRGVRQRRPAAAAQFRLRSACGSSSPTRSPSIRTSRP